MEIIEQPKNPGQQTLLGQMAATLSKKTIIPEKNSSQTFFKVEPERIIPAFFKKLHGTLQLSDHMGPDSVTRCIQQINYIFSELKVTYKPYQFKPLSQLNFGDKIDLGGMTAPLKSLNENECKPVIEILMEIYALLEQNHDQYLEQQKGSANCVSYNKEMLQESQALLDIKTTTLQLPEKEKTHSLLVDLDRGIKVNGERLKKKIFEGQEAFDKRRIEIIEKLTGDKASEPSSQAATLLAHGGQALYGMLLDEFNQKMQLESDDKLNISSQFMLGSIDWRKDNNDVIGSISIEIYSISVSSNDKSYFGMLGSDGKTLLEYRSNFHDTVNQMFKKGKEAFSKGEPMTTMRPLATVSATLTLKNSVEQKYYIEPTAFRIDYFTSGLKHKESLSNKVKVELN